MTNYFLPPIHQQNKEPAHLHINKLEGENDRLIFHKSAFQTVQYGKKPAVPAALYRCIEEYNPGDEILVVKNELSDYITSFHASRKKLKSKNEPVNLTQFAHSKLRNFDGNTWRSVYEKRLGINFCSSYEWFKKIASGDLPTALNELLVRYIFYVDMIITIIPRPEGVELDRIQAFKTALARFEEKIYNDISQDVIKNANYITKQEPAVWTYLGYWISHDTAYYDLRSINGLAVSNYWKPFFDLVFAHSIDRLTDKAIQAVKPPKKRKRPT